jgi:hypothetical protein
VYISLFQLSSQLTDFYETWYWRLTKRRTINFLQSVAIMWRTRELARYERVSSNNVADARTCEIRACG